MLVQRGLIKVKIHQGDIFWVDLEPTKGKEQQKLRPCVVVSNDKYNLIFNTAIVAPISSSSKYLTEEKYLKSPFFVPINCEEIHGAILLQHIRALDINVRSNLKKLGSLPQQQLAKVLSIIKYEF